MSTPERIQKIIAQAGLASRREAETLIADGLVTVNGKTAKLGDKATLGEDAIKVKGKLIGKVENKVYYLFYKPKNVIAMVNEDEEGRDTIKTFTRGIKERVFTVGRMDFSGEGAILLTNDGEAAQQLTKSNDLIRRYHVKVDRHPTKEDLERISRGGRIEKVSMNPHHVRVVQEYTKNALIEVSFQGSGVTEIRKFFENKGFFPEKVIRVGIGHLKADNMKPGEIRKVEASSIQALLGQPELATKLIENIVKKKTKRNEHTEERTFEDKKDRAPRADRADRPAFSDRAPRADRPAFGGKKFSSIDKEARPSRRPPRGRPLPAERAAGIKRAPRGDIPMPRFKREDGARPAFGDRKPSFGRGAPRGGDRPSFGDRARGDRPMRSNFGDRKPFGDRPPRGAVRGGGERSERPAFGDRKPSFGRGAPRGGGDRPAFGDRKPFGERKSFGDRKPFGERKSFGDRAPRGGGDRPSFGRGAPRGGSDRPARAGGGRGGFQPRFKRG
jgi:23S rRNA pseudouridine2605 synthase